jgi:hypothetical protein
MEEEVMASQGSASTGVSSTTCFNVIWTELYSCLVI